MLNSWRTLACVLGHAATRTALHATRRAAAVAGVAAALLLGDAAAGTPAGAAPSAAVAAAVTAAPKTKRKPSAGAKARARRGKTAAHATRRGGRRSAARKSAAKSAARSRARAGHRRTVRRSVVPAAPAAAALTLPVVDLPTVALTADGAAANWEAALGAAPAAPTQPAGGSLAALSRSATSLLDGLVARARGQLGTRYVYGGAAPGAELDCSSFVRYVMEALDVRLPRTANQQARVGRAVPRDPSQLRPGDLLTFGRGRNTSHVGIYLGQGRFIHASVKSGRVIETTIERNGALFRRWQGARRLLAGADSVDGDVAGSGG